MHFSSKTSLSFPKNAKIRHIYNLATCINEMFVLHPKVIAFVTPSALAGSVCLPVYTCNISHT